MANCFEDCKTRVYTYGPPKDFQAWDGIKNKLVPHDPTAAEVAAAQAKINSLDKVTDSCEKGCECVADAVQVAPYPKNSKQVNDWGTLPSGIIFNYTKQFMTFTGQCDRKHPLASRTMIEKVSRQRTT